MRKRVLVVDDEMTLLRAYGRLLRRAGYHVGTATDVASALRLLERSSFDATVADIKMPGIDGIAFAKVLREREIPTALVLMTGAVDEGVAEAVRMLEGVDLLQKPFGSDVLVDAITRAIAGAK